MMVSWMDFEALCTWGVAISSKSRQRLKREVPFLMTVTCQDGWPRH